MRIVICGGGATGRHVAHVLADVHDVVLIDNRQEVRDAAPPTVRFVLGDAGDPAILMRAGARDADAVVAVTRDDPTNLLVALLAKRWLGVSSTVARLVDPEHRWLYTPEAGVDVVVSSAELVARLVQEEVTASDLVTLLRLRGGGVAVTETAVPPGADIAGQHVDRIAVPPGVAFTAVLRDGTILLPGGAGALRAGDVIVALCEPGREHVLHELLTRASR